MTEKYTQTKDELRARLRETLRHINRSAEAYDAGDESEARRLATEIRKLVKHKPQGQSKALLQQLGILQSVGFLNTCRPFVPGNMLIEHSMVAIKELAPGGSVKLFIAVPNDSPMRQGIGPGNVSANQSARYSPILGETHTGRFRKRLFPEWWNMPIIRINSVNIEFSRREIIEGVAEQDGGVHVDPTLNAKYAMLTRANPDGWFDAQTDGKLTLIRSMELAHVRQISYEITESLNQKYPELFLP